MSKPLEFNIEALHKEYFKMIKDITRQASTILSTLLILHAILISEKEPYFRPTTNDIQNLNDATLLNI